LDRNWLLRPSDNPTVAALKRVVGYYHEFLAHGRREEMDRDPRLFWVLHLDTGKPAWVYDCGSALRVRLVAALGHQNGKVRCSAARTLGECLCRATDPEDRDLSPLVAALSDGDEEVRRAAAESLGKVRAHGRPARP
jgi:HEAT repeat protein